MTPVTFKGYGVHGSDVTIIAEQILCWWAIDYNGDYGTCIVLSSGKEINVRDWPTDVERKVKEIRHE